MNRRHPETLGGFPDPPAGPLLEVAVALPVRGTYTYRDPRGAAPVPLGTQVVVPFGARTVTGFVVGHPVAGGGAGDVVRAPALDVEEIVAGMPAFDDEMIALCRWAADYYQAPLGEVLRAALPQGEKATAIRSVRLTEAGRRALRAAARRCCRARRRTAIGVLAALEAAGGALPMKALARLDARASAHAARLAAQGLVEVGDRGSGAQAPPVDRIRGARRGRRALCDCLRARSRVARWPTSSPPSPTVCRRRRSARRSARTSSRW